MTLPSVITVGRNLRSQIEFRTDQRHTASDIKTRGWRYLTNLLSVARWSSRMRDVADNVGNQNGTSPALPVESGGLL